MFGGMVYDHLIGPYLLQTRLERDSYLVYLREVLAELFTCVQLQIKQRMWFQYDGTPDYIVDVRNALDIMYWR